MTTRASPDSRLAEPARYTTSGLDAWAAARARMAAEGSTPAGPHLLLAWLLVGAELNAVLATRHDVTQRQRH